MPYVNGEVFVKRQPPEDLDPDEELFFSPTTLEVFRDYDEYFERTILVNSVVWTCSVCGRGPTTYTAADLCERVDRRHLEAFSPALSAGLLYIIAASKRQRLPELVELLRSFASTRCFVGEPVEFLLRGASSPTIGTIQLITLSADKPTDAVQTSSRNNLSGSPRNSYRASGFVDVASLLYHILPCSNNKASSESSVGDRPAAGDRVATMNVAMLPPCQVRRYAGSSIMSRDRIRFFIRNTCTLINGCFTPKVSVMQKHRVAPHGPLTWSRLFVPPEPRWAGVWKPSPLAPAARPLPATAAGKTSRRKAISPMQNKQCRPEPAELPILPLTAASQSKLKSYQVIDSYNDGRPTVVWKPLARGSARGTTAGSASTTPVGEQPGTACGNASYSTASSKVEQLSEGPRGSAVTCIDLTGEDQEQQQQADGGVFFVADPLRPGSVRAAGLAAHKAGGGGATAGLLYGGNAVDWYRDRVERVEKADLLREWFLLRKREDLELTDLVPLPDFPKLQTSLPANEIGSALQLFDFLHVFAGQLNLFASKPSAREYENRSLTWSNFQACLLDTNPCGLLADIFIGFLSTIRKFEMEVNNRQLTQSALALTYAAASAATAAETGSALVFHGASAVSTGECSAIYEELFASPDTVRVLAEAAVGARYAELVGISTLAAVRSANQATRVVTNLLASASDRKSTAADCASLRHAQARAASMATLAGAAALCPLDRAGISLAVWLHFVCAAARGGGWRGQIRGGTRPLDDPAVMLARYRPSLLRKLRSVSVYELPVGDKLTLLTCLMDELLLQPSMRDSLEEQFEIQRALLLSQRSLHSERALASLGYKPVSVVVESDARSGPATAVPVAKTTVTVQDEQLGDGGADAVVDKRKSGKKTKKRSKSSRLSAEHRPTTTVEPPPDSRQSAKSTDPKKKTVSGETESADRRAAKLVKSAEDEQRIWEQVFEASRGSAMFPLGEDRFYRRYWLVLSIPCLLIESPVDSPAFTTALNVTSRQVSTICPALAEPLGLVSTESSAVLWRGLIASLGQQSAGASAGSDPVLTLDRETLTHRVQQKMAKIVEVVNPSLVELEQIVHPQYIRLSDLANHVTNPAVLQRQHLRDQMAETGTSIWFILRPFSGHRLPDYQEEARCEPRQTTSDEVPTGSAGAPVTGVRTRTSRQAAVSDPPADEEDAKQEATTGLSLSERAAWTLDCLEASLNVRGVREAHLRKVIGQLRPLLLRVIAQCPRQLHPYGDDDPKGIPTTDDNHRTSSLSEDTGTAASAAVGAPPPPLLLDKLDSVGDLLLSWFELGLFRMVKRLGIADQCRSFLSQPESEENSKNGASDGPIGEEMKKGNTDNCASDLCEPLHQLSTTTTQPTAAGGLNASLEDDGPSRKEARLKAAAERLFRVGQLVFTRGLAGPVSTHLNTLRASTTRTRTVAAAGVNHLPLNFCSSSFEGEPGDPQTTPVAVTDTRTTGWDRWCSATLAATSPSHLHLLGRALERCARHAVTVARSLSNRSPAASAVGAGVNSRLRCTACCGPPDRQSKGVGASGSGTSSSNPGSAPATSAPGTHQAQVSLPLSVCAGCAAPFHLDCLLNWSSRVPQPQQRFSLRCLRQPRQARQTTTMMTTAHTTDLVPGLSSLALLQQPSNATDWTGHLGTMSPFTSVTVARAETMGASLFLCDACRSLASDSLPVVLGREAARERQLVSAHDSDEDPPDDGCSDGHTELRSDDDGLETEEEGGCSPRDSETSVGGGRRKALTGQQQTSTGVRSTVAVEYCRPLPIKRTAAARANLAAKRNRSPPPPVEEQVAPRRSDRVSSSLSSRKPGDVDDVVEKPSGATGKRKASNGPVEDSTSLPNGELKNERNEKVVEFGKLTDGQVYLRTASVVLNHCDSPGAGCVSPGGSRRSSTGRAPKRAHSSLADAGELPSPSLLPSVDQTTAEQLLTQLCSLPSAKPFLRCGAGRSCSDHHGLGSIESADSSPPSSVGGQEEEANGSLTGHRRSSWTEKRYASDLCGLQDILTQRKLPLGPEQAVDQLRLLIGHWLKISRPGSRVHQCASELSTELEQRLARLCEGTTVESPGVVTTRKRSRLA